VRLRNLKLLYIAVLATAVVGCARLGAPGSPDPSPQQSYEPAPSSSHLASLVETVPPDWVLHPDWYDSAHCALPAPSESQPLCPPPAYGSPDPNDPGEVWGFSGPLFVNQLNAAAVVLLDSTVLIASEGNWRAAGLVRNETGGVVGGVTIHAELRGTDGSVLGTISTDALLPRIRPGEPAPFVISANVDRVSVASVGWSVSIGEYTSTPIPRRFLVNLNWWRQYGDRDPITVPDFPADPQDPPFPYALEGDATSYAATPISSIHVLIAFLDESGRVLWAGEAAPFGALGGAPGDIKDMNFSLRVDDAKVGPHLEAASPMWWAYGDE
jgi:hypothetical protein